MSNLGNFMKKRTRDLLIGAGLVGVGTVGALAFLVDASQRKEINLSGHGPGTIIITNGEKTMSGTEIRTPTQSEQGTRIINPQHQPYQTNHQGPAYQTSQGSFTNNTNFNNSIPNVPVNHSSNNSPNTQSNASYGGQNANAQGVCAPEALAVGIKHFKYADSHDLVPSGYGSDPKFQIHRDAKPALQEMVRAARADGVTLTPGSIFRSESRQRQIVNNKKSQGQSARQIYRTSSHPGYSEHHTGLAVDFTPINDGFKKTAGYRWLLNNAHKYGFYQTFTADYSAYSGVAEESWHWRYEGKNGEFSHIFYASKNRQC